jgi:cell division protein FtsB
MVTRRTERMVQRGLLWGATGVLVVLALLLGVSTWRVYSKMALAKAERVEAEVERDQLVKRTTELGAALDALGTDRGIEEEIRARYPLVKPGEVEIVLVDGKEVSPVDTVPTTRESIWAGLKHRFGF